MTALDHHTSRRKAAAACCVPVLMVVLSAQLLSLPQPAYSQTSSTTWTPLETTTLTGAGLQTVYNMSAYACGQACVANSKCVAFTSSSLSSSSYACYLKTASGNASFLLTSYSGVIASRTSVPIPSVPLPQMTIMNNTIFNGAGVQTITNVTFEQCAKACAAYVKCQAVTYTPSGNKTCWLKSEQGTYKVGTLYTSALLGSPLANAVPPGASSTWVDVSTASPDLGGIIPLNFLGLSLEWTSLGHFAKNPTA
jgi:hypothetical protein